MSKLLDEPTRRDAFARLVRLQDDGGKVDETRAMVAASFGITVSLLQWIESEGIRKQWPPLRETTSGSEAPPAPSDGVLAPADPLSEPSDTV